MSLVYKRIHTYVVKCPLSDDKPYVIYYIMYIMYIKLVMGQGTYREDEQGKVRKPRSSLSGVCELD